MRRANNIKRESANAIHHYVLRNIKDVLRKSFCHSDRRWIAVFNTCEGVQSIEVVNRFSREIVRARTKRKQFRLFSIQSIIDGGFVF